MTAPKSALRPIRFIGVGIGLFALLLQLLLPVGLAVASDGSGSDFSRFGLCLSDDGKRLFLGFDDPSDASPSYDCPFCISAKETPHGVPAGDVAALALPQARAFHYIKVSDVHAASHETLYRPWIRGPPSA